MKKETLLTVAVIVLLLLNVGTLGFLFLNKPPRPKPLDKQIIQKLALDPQQIEKFDQLKKAHQEQMLSCDERFRDGMENYMSLLKNDTIETTVQDSLQAILTNIQAERAQVTLQHFMALKALCNPEQRNIFESMVPELVKGISLPKRPRGRQRDDR